jgi:hypothetical protein
MDASRTPKDIQAEINALNSKIEALVSASYSEEAILLAPRPDGYEQHPIPLPGLRHSPFLTPEENRVQNARYVQYLMNLPSEARQILNGIPAFTNNTGAGTGGAEEESDRRDKQLKILDEIEQELGNLVKRREELQNLLPWHGPGGESGRGGGVGTVRSTKSLTRAHATGKTKRRKTKRRRTKRRRTKRR